MAWTIFTVIDLFVGVLLLDLMTTAVPPEKLGRLRVVRGVTLVLLLMSAIVLAVQIAHRHGWIMRK